MADFFMGLCYMSENVTLFLDLVSLLSHTICFVVFFKFNQNIVHHKSAHTSVIVFHC